LVGPLGKFSAEEYTCANTRPRVHSIAVYGCPRFCKKRRAINPKGLKHMGNHSHVPWQLKIAAKVILSRVPLSPDVRRRMGLFQVGAMQRPDYALRVFRRHFDKAVFARKEQPFVTLELGPGFSVFSAVVARSLGASATYAVDVSPLATTDVQLYRDLVNLLRNNGLNPPSLDDCHTLDDILQKSGGVYLTQGVESLKTIPTASVDFVWSHSVLQHVRRKDFVPFLTELRRIQRPDGVGSHTVSIADILGGNLNDLRFSEKTWESDLMANSGFYTNRIRYNEYLRYFTEAGFIPQVYRTAQWDTLPTPRNKMAPEFAQLPEAELQISGFDVYLH
jgi:SAM-dependent methyltransferase